MPTLQFKGKTFVQNHHLAVPFHQLVPQPDKSLTDKVSLNDNLILHGDNLTALKALLPTYAGKVKCIYIDPPYNTGNEGWVYNDNVKSPLIKEWIGQVVGKEGEDLVRHDKWLCMMMPRLKLLRELLTPDGLIFISIDNNEIHLLRSLMDEVFGADNFISMIADVNNPKGRSDDKYIATAHEYVLIYKREQEPKLYGWEPEEKVTKRYRKVDKTGLKWREIDLRKTGEGDRREDRPNMFYYFLFNEKTNELTPTKDEEVPEGFIQIKPVKDDEIDGRWRWEINTAIKNIDRLYARYMPNKKVWSVFEKDYLNEDERVTPTSAWTKKDFNSERGTEQFIELGFKKEDFPKPKPIGLIKHILEFATSEEDIILDSFAGSGSTAQAVLEMNEKDRGNRRFILVECEDYADSITAERVRRVIKGVPNAKNELVKKGLGGSFSYFELGDAIEMESLLAGKSLPNYSDLARYLFYTATGEEFKPDALDESSNYVGKTDQFDVYMYYKPDLEYLKTTALTLDTARALREKAGSRPLLVFAPTKYVEQQTLDELNITFCQLPFEIYRLKN